MKKLLITSILLMVLMNWNCFSQQAPPAKQIIENALSQAKEENKNVMLIFHASWCGWCKKMDASMNDASCKKLFDDNYVTIHLTVDENEKNKNLENPDADVYRKIYHGESAGLPFWVILNQDGKLIGDSFIRKADQTLNEPGENMGCPAAENEVAEFCNLLAKSSRINEKEMKIIAERFKKNK
jgi:thiol-disulfide isomerase/thioredoxin